MVCAFPLLFLSVMQKQNKKQNKKFGLGLGIFTGKRFGWELSIGDNRVFG